MDIHICGHCKQQFTNIDSFFVHKRSHTDTVPVIYSTTNRLKQAQAEQLASQSQHNSNGNNSVLMDCIASQLQTSHSLILNDNNYGCVVDNNNRTQETSIINTLNRYTHSSTLPLPSSMNRDSVITRPAGIVYDLPCSWVYSEGVISSTTSVVNNGQATPSQTQMSSNVGRVTEVFDKAVEAHNPNAHDTERSSSVLYPSTGSIDLVPANNLNCPVSLPTTNSNSHSNPPTSCRKFVCSYTNCNFSVSDRKDFDRHMRTHTKEKPFSCTYCSKAFSRKDKLTLHVRSHTGYKPYSCKTCSYKCTDPSSLKKHERTHSDERPYKCQLCPHASRTSQHLVVHLRSHTGDAPFQCSQCPMKFKISSDLKRHLRVHTGQRPYRCDYCTYSSALKCNIQSHTKLVHEGSTKYVCSEHGCQFQTSSLKHFKRHSKQHNPNLLFKCVSCTFICGSKSSLSAHQKVHSSMREFRRKNRVYCSNFHGSASTHVKNVRNHKHLPKPVGDKFKSVKFFNVSQKPASAKSLQNFKKHFACSFSSCGETFVRADSLRSHLKNHTPLITSETSVHHHGVQNPSTQTYMNSTPSVYSSHANEMSSVQRKVNVKNLSLSKTYQHVACTSLSTVPYSYTIGGTSIGHTPHSSLNHITTTDSHNAFSTVCTDSITQPVISIPYTSTAVISKLVPNDNNTTRNTTDSSMYIINSDYQCEETNHLSNQLSLVDTNLHPAPSSVRLLVIQQTEPGCDSHSTVLHSNSVPLTQHVRDESCTADTSRVFLSPVQIGGSVFCTYSNNPSSDLIHDPSHSNRLELCQYINSNDSSQLKYDRNFHPIQQTTEINNVCYVIEASKVNEELISTDCNDGPNSELPSGTSEQNFYTVNSTQVHPVHEGLSSNCYSTPRAVEDTDEEGSSYSHHDFTDEVTRRIKNPSQKISSAVFTGQHAVTASLTGSSTECHLLKVGHPLEVKTPNKNIQSDLVSFSFTLPSPANTQLNSEVDLANRVVIPTSSTGNLCGTVFYLTQQPTTQITWATEEHSKVTQDTNLHKNNTVLSFNQEKRSSTEFKIQ